MPRKTFNKRKPTTKRTYKRKRTTRKSGGTGPRSTGLKGPMKLYGSFAPFPPTYTCKQHYVENFTLGGGTAGVFGTEQVMRLNSLFDPNATVGGGHQPYGFDQMTALYRRYLVYGCLVKLTFTDPQSDGIAVAALVQSSGGVGGLTGVTSDIIAEQPLSWVRPINNTGNQVKVFKMYFPLQKIEGLQKVQWIANQDDYGALVTANPALMPTIRFAAGTDNGTSIGTAIFCRCEMTFYTRFYDRILQAAS